MAVEQAQLLEPQRMQPAPPVQGPRAGLAVQHHLPVPVGAELGQPAPEVLERNVDGARKVSRPELRGGADVDEGRWLLPGQALREPRGETARIASRRPFITR